MKKYISLLRIKHYIKNLLIFLPLIFSGQFLNLPLLFITIVEFFSFSFVASAIYIMNDLIDYESDRKHPIKRKRTIASGLISKKQASIILIVLLLLSMGVQILLYQTHCFTHTQFGLSNIYLLLYLAINFIYSKWGKHLPIVDILLLASGFLLRVYFGGVIIDVAISSWLYLTILSLSLYLVIGKRRGELKKNKKDARPVLKFYTSEFLDKFMYVFLSLTLVFYALWCTSGFVETNNLLIYSLFFVIFIVMKYSLIVEGDSYGDPVDVFFHDKTLIVVTILYGIYMGVVLYG